MLTDQARDLMLQFADAHLAPYKLKSGSGGEKIIPQLCPYCHGGSSGKDTNTFALSIDKGVFVCKRGSCGRHGRFETLAKEIAGETVHLPSDGSQKRSAHIDAEPSYVLPVVSTHPPTPQIYEYFQKRGISQETVDYFRIASSDDGMIVFPFYDHSVLTYVKFRRPWKPTPEELRLKGKEWQVSNTRQILFNLDSIDYSQPVYLTEGMIDAMALYQVGIHNVVSVPSGCDNMNWIQNCWDTLEKIKQFILFGDADAPGQRMIQELTKRLGEYRCKVITQYPDNPKQPGVKCKDADEILVRLGEFELLDTVESAEDVEVKGLIDIGDIEPVDTTTLPRISTKIPRLDECIGGLMEGSVLLISGASGRGKSTFASQLLLSAVQAGHICCAYSGELPKEKFCLWMYYQAAGYQYIGLKYDKFYGHEVPHLDGKICKRIQQWLKHKVYIYDNKLLCDKSRAESILELFTVAVKKNNCSVFLCDNLMTALSDDDEELKAQTRFINELKSFAEKYSVTVLCVAHPRKLRTGDKIGLWDVAGSANIVNIADAAIVIERPDIRVIKSRENGRETLISCCYEPCARRIYQADVGDKNNFGWNREGVEKPAVLADTLPEYQVQLGDNNGAAPF
jgi:twinkle protein